MTLHFSIGLMSGTSMDGVEAALVQTDGQDVCNFIDEASISYDRNFQRLLKKTESIIHKQDGTFDLQQYIEKGITLQNVINQSTLFHYKAIEKVLNNNPHIKEEDYIIGYHGQTFFHHPEKGKSIVLGNPMKMAQYFRRKVVADFRKNDVLHGGNGAPLAPIYHYFLAQKSNKIPAAFLNCGGILNITCVENNNEKEVVAFDIGPGNVFLDQFVKIKTNYAYTFDKDGLFGKNGKCHFDLLNLLDEQSCVKKYFYNKEPPKALDISDFYLPPEILNLSLEDGCKTLAYFTAKKIADSLIFIKIFPNNWYVSGGGFNNPNILEALHYYFKKSTTNPFTLNHSDILGYPSKSLEAQLFGYLAIRSYYNFPLSFPQTTGVKKPLTGGFLYFPTEYNL